MKQDAQENLNLSSRIYSKNVTNLSEEGKKKIPIENNLKRTFRRIRSNNYPKLKSINELNLDNSKWATTGGKDPQQFLLYDNKNNKNRILVFASQLCLKSLSPSKHIFMDGTFATCPRGFFQVYIIHAQIGESSLPIVYVLLQNKTKETYKEMLLVLKKYCSSVEVFSIDFEQAMIKAIEDVFENKVIIQLCYFHLNQSMRRKVQELGLAIKYKENKQFKQDVQLISALAFLPVNMIKTGMSILYDTINYNDDVDDILTYFDSMYFNGNYKATTTEFETTYLKRQPPIFPPYLWSV
ncbi:hypothetical protein QTP88_015172 [Uroleucon formosanum]